jgi:hypothetical protein
MDYEQSMVTHTCNPSTWDAKAEESQVSGQPGYIITPRRVSKSQRKTVLWIFVL